MKTAYFDQCSCCINNDKNNNPEETELDINPSLTLPRTLTLSIGERIFGLFTSSLVTTPDFLFCVYESTKKMGRDPESRSEINLRRKITIAWKWRLKNKYAGNRSWRKWVSEYVIPFRQDNCFYQYLCNMNIDRNVLVSYDTFNSCCTKGQKTAFFPMNFILRQIGVDFTGRFLGGYCCVENIFSVKV